MSGLLHKMEHAAHAEKGHEGHGHGHAHHHPSTENLGRAIGITMALLGVLLALCAALVGSEREELTKTMVDQTNAYNEFQAESMKYRMMISELQMLHALTPSKGEAQKFKGDLEQMRADSGNQYGVVLEALELSSTAVADVLTPDHADLVHFVKLVRKYEKEREIAKKWAESYEAVVDAHFVSSEWYEKGQLASEIGIVIASIALLLGSRRFWWLAMVAGAVSAVVVVGNWVHSHGQLKTTLAAVDVAHTAYVDERARNNAKKDDEALLETIEKAEDVGEVGTPAPK
jgi:hypothetical protein